ncbi:MAG: metal-dependent hydrolase [Candidatus Woesearchaeota archaeon]
MLFWTHLSFGILGGLLALDHFTGGSYVLFFFLVLLGAVFPDIDERDSKITQWTGLFGKIVSLLNKHRGFFHSLLFVAVALIISSVFLTQFYSWGLFLGLCSHLFLDSLTPAGVPLLYPFERFKARGWLRTGGVGEVVVLFLVVVGIVWVVL